MVAEGAQGATPRERSLPNDRKVRRALRRQDAEPRRARGGDRQALGGRRASSSTSCACRRRERGSAAAPTSTRSPRTGSGPEDATEDEGIEHLVRRYLQGFGPARPDGDRGLGGVSTLSTTKRALERLELRRFQDEQGKELVDLPRLPLPDADTPAPVRFLPVWDATLLVHARRTQILPERYRPRVFNVRTPHSVNTFLVDGQVAGTWRYEKGRVKLAPFGRLTQGQRGPSWTTKPTASPSSTRKALKCPADAEP